MLFDYCLVNNEISEVVVEGFFVCGILFVLVIGMVLDYLLVMFCSGVVFSKLYFIVELIVVFECVC